MLRHSQIVAAEADRHEAPTSLREFAAMFSARFNASNMMHLLC